MYQAAMQFFHDDKDCAIQAITFHHDKCSVSNFAFFMYKFSPFKIKE